MWNRERWATGAIRKGQELKLLDEGQASDNVGVLLRGTRREDVQRGQVLTKPGSITPHTPFFKGYRRIRLKAFDHRLIDTSAKEIVDTSRRAHRCNRASPQAADGHPGPHGQDRGCTDEARAAGRRGRPDQAELMSPCARPARPGAMGHRADASTLSARSLPRSGRPWPAMYGCVSDRRRTQPADLPRADAGSPRRSGRRGPIAGYRPGLLPRSGPAC